MKQDKAKEKIPAKIVKALSRPPVVVVLGHVDHGKTTLLDYIRKTNLATKEIGQITQHIGAYQAMVGEERITFIDTPGHEAFEKMRSRGAKVADVAVLVVAADDGVMPQTKEAIQHIKSAKIPFVVALNKSDLPGVDLEKVKKRLLKENVLLEGYGGEVVALPISAKTGEGIKDLLEMIILIAEMTDLEGDPQGPLQAVVVESRLDAHRGPVASVLIKNGTLRVGDDVFTGEIKGHIRAMTNDQGVKLLKLGPGESAEIAGLETVPAVGEILSLGRPSKSMQKVTAPTIFLKKEEETKLNIILKTDVLGTLEAIINGLKSLPIKIIDSGTGDVSEGDIMLAKTTRALIVGFNVKASASAVKLAKTEKIIIKTYQIIYKLIEEIKEVIENLLRPVEEEIFGKAEIIAEFAVKQGKIAGVKVIQGRLAVGDQVTVLRNNNEISKTRIKSLKQQQAAVSKIELGKEGGALFEPALDFKIGDIVISPS